MKARRYRDEYEISEVKKDGKTKKEVVYIGDFYSYKGSNEEFKNLKKQFLLRGIILLILYISGGVFDYSGSRTIYVVLPYAIAVLPVAYLVLGTGKLFFAKERMQHIEYDETIGRIRKCLIAILLLSAMSAVGEVIFMIRTEIDFNYIKEIFFIFLMLGVAVITYFFRKLIGRIEFTKIMDKNE